MQGIGYPSNGIDEKLNRSWWWNTSGINAIRQPLLPKLGGLKGGHTVSSIQGCVIRRTWEPWASSEGVAAREEMKLLQGMLPKAGGLQVSPTVTHPTVLPIDKVQLKGSLHRSLENWGCGNQPPSMDGRAMGRHTDQGPACMLGRWNPSQLS